MASSLHSPQTKAGEGGGFSDGK